LDRSTKKLYNRHADAVETHHIMAVLEFNSNRKRMSVVVEDVATKKRTLLTKGTINRLY
jgi:magnesium-transporting ATPase (P-type)